MKKLSEVLKSYDANGCKLPLDEKVYKFKVRCIYNLSEEEANKSWNEFKEYWQSKITVPISSIM